MKKQSKFLMSLLALVLVMLMSIPTMAAPSYTLTLNNTGATSHTFDVYQVFKGDLSIGAGGQKVLSNIVWGNGVTGAGQSALGDATAKAESITSELEAKAFANVLVSNSYLTGAVTKTVAAGATDTITGLEPGYYLVKDRDSSQSGDGSAYTAYILEVVGNVTATTKLDVPSVEKKVKDINDSDDNDISDNPWHDSADHDIGDIIPYQITGTLPTNYGDYSSYYYQFTDEMSNGLTYNGNAKVFVVNGSSETEITSQAVIAPGTETQGATLTVTIDDLKTITGVTVDKDSKIVVRYTATLNSNAVIGSTGNPNTVFLKYSNNPNPGGTGTGTTPKDKTVVFTYQVVINKVDENELPLPNAGFTLYKKDSSGTWQTVKAISASSATSFTFTGIDDGDYKLVETEVPDGYNKFKDIEFTVTAVHETVSSNPTLISINSATSDNTVITLSGTQQANVILSSGTISTNVVNRSGSILPTTGGIGTKIFYICGGVLIIGALITLIAKKNRRAEA